MSTTNGVPQFPKTREEWQKALDALPSTPDKIPAFFFGHGSPMLAWQDSGRTPGMETQGSKGTLYNFLADFGPKLLEKYKPKGTVVFSAHWETGDERQVTDYGEKNPLLMDYYGFPPELYELEFTSRGDSSLVKRIVELYEEAGQRARAITKSEQRGQDGRGFLGPGLDHGVFIPFRIMFGHEFLDVPIVQVSIHESLSPDANWSVGKALSKLREEGILILSGGLVVHNLRDRASFSEKLAGSVYKEFDQAILDAVSLPDSDGRREALVNLTRHQGFRVAHPRSEHFVPLYVAAGAGEDGDARIVEALYGAHTFVFGL